MELFTLQNVKFDSDDLPVVLEYKFENIEPLDIFRSSIPSLILPATQTNNRLLKNFGYIEASEIDPMDVYILDKNKVKYDAKLYVREVIIENNKPKRYICYLIGEELDLLSDLEGTLADLEMKVDYNEEIEPSFDWSYREQPDYTFPFNQWNYRTPFPFDPPAARVNYMEQLAYSYGNSQTSTRLIPTNDYFQPNDSFALTEAPRKWWINNIEHLYSNSHIPIQNFAFYNDEELDVDTLKVSEYSSRVINENLKDIYDTLEYNQPFIFQSIITDLVTFEISENFLEEELTFPTKETDNPNGILTQKTKRHTESTFGYSVKETISEIFKQKLSIPDDKVNVDFTALENTTPILDLNFYKFENDIEIDIYDIDNYTQFNGFELHEDDLKTQINDIKPIAGNTQVPIRFDGSDRSGEVNLPIPNDANVVHDNFVYQLQQSTNSNFYGVMSKAPQVHHFDFNLGNEISFTKNGTDPNYTLGGGFFSNEWEFRIKAFMFDYYTTVNPSVETQAGEWITYTFPEYEVNQSIFSDVITLDGDVVIPFQFKTAAEYTFVRFVLEGRPTNNNNFVPQPQGTFESASIKFHSDWQITNHPTCFVERSDLPYILQGYIKRISDGEDNLFPNENIPTARYKKELFESDKPVRDFVIDFLKLFNLSIDRINNPDGTVTFKFKNRIDVISNTPTKIDGNDDYKFKILEPISSFNFIGENFVVNKNAIRNESVDITSDLLPKIRVNTVDYNLYEDNFHGFVISELAYSMHGNITPTYVPDGTDLFVRSGFRDTFTEKVPPGRLFWSEYFVNTSKNILNPLNSIDLYNNYWKDWINFLDKNRKEIEMNIYGDLALFNDMLKSRIIEIKGGLYLLRNIKLDINRDRMSIKALKINNPL